MKFVQIAAYGHPSNTLQVNSSAPIPRINAGDDVLIRVHSTSLNPIDYKLAKGEAGPLYSPVFPYIPGCDVAGQVIEVGKNVTDFKAGDRVYGTFGPLGKTMAEYCIGKDSQLAKIPSSLTYSQAAAIPLVALTSYQALFNHGNLKSGQRVLIFGGASATGQAAIQFAKAVGAFVITTASTRNIELVQGLGADVVIDYTKQKWEEVLKYEEKFNIVYDTVGEERSWERGSKFVGKDGIFLQISLGNKTLFTVGFLLRMGFSLVGRKIASLFGCTRYAFVMTDTSEKGNGGKQLEIINKWIEEGKYHQIIGQVYPFNKEGAVQSLEEIAKGKSRGKLVIEIITPSSPTISSSSH